MRVLVCGGRDFDDALDLERILRPYQEKVTALIHGGARGADTLAAFWAIKRGIHVEAFDAEWLRYGVSAGPMRNQRMLDEGKPDLVIAFPGHKGTADMVKRAKQAGIRVLEVPPRQ